MAAETKNFDLAVIGAGPGGYVAAIRAAQLGMRVVIIEKEPMLGGTCLNIGCIPSKALLDTSELYSSARTSFGEHGILTENLSLDLAKVMERKRTVVDRLTGGVASLMKKNRIQVERGTGIVTAAGSLEIRTEAGARKINAASIVLATGSVPQELPFLPFDGRRIISSTEALSLKKVPRRLAVVGGGAIGLELGSVWSRFGSSVTVVELMDDILPGWDGQVRRTLRRELERQGMMFHVSTKVRSCETRKSEVTLRAESAKGEELEIPADVVLVAVGRRPYHAQDLTELGIEMDGPRVKVDSSFQTSVAGIYAIGDIVHGPMLAHKAEDEGVCCVERLAGVAGEVRYDTIPGIVYTWPEAASAGSTEESLREAGTAYRKGTFLFRANGRALALGSDEGFVKILAHEVSDLILGVHIVGPWASALIPEVVSVMEFGGSSEDVARTIHAHPTLSEVVREAALAVEKRALHA